MKSLSSLQKVDYRNRTIAIGADYSYVVKYSEIWAPTFFKHYNSFIATVDTVDILSRSDCKTMTTNIFMKLSKFADCKCK